MKLISINLENYRGVHHLEMPLDKKLTVLTGSNGTGKTTIIDAVAVLVSWITARTRSLKSSGRSISEKQIQNGMKAAKISAFADTPQTHPLATG